MKRYNTVTRSGLLIGVLLLGGYSYAMPQHLCISSKDPISVSVRLRATAVFIDNKGSSHLMGDIYPDKYTYGSIYSEDLCFDSKDLIDAFYENNTSANRYYFSKVHLDVRHIADCHLEGDDSIHSWILAPRKGTAYFNYSTSGLIGKCLRDWGR